MRHTRVPRMVAVATITMVWSAACGTGPTAKPVAAGGSTVDSVGSACPNVSTGVPTVPATSQPAVTSKPPATPTSTAPTPSQMPFEQVLATTFPNVIRIAITTCDGGAGMGSGFLLGNGLVMTAAHVVDDESTVTVAQEGGRRA